MLTHTWYDNIPDQGASLKHLPPLVTYGASYAPKWTIACALTYGSGGLHSALLLRLCCHITPHANVYLVMLFVNLFAQP